MSDTDDTDDLLLIPPDFFAVYSDSEDQEYINRPYFAIVDSLISQVSRLEDRLNTIESASDSNLLTTSEFTLNSLNSREIYMSGVRRFNSCDNLSKPGFSSTNSTPQKPRQRVKGNSLPSTPSTDQNRVTVPKRNACFNRSNFANRKHYSVHANSKQDIANRSKMLNEIDKFIENVKVIQRHSIVRSLEAEMEAFSEYASDRGHADATHAMNMNDIDEMLQEMESQQREIETRLRKKEHDLETKRSNHQVKETCYKENTWKEGDNKTSVPDYGMGMRDILYDDKYKNVEPLVNKVNISPTEEVPKVCSPKHSDSDNSHSSSDITQMTAYQKRIPVILSPDTEQIHANAMQVLNMHKNLLSHSGNVPNKVDTANHIDLQKHSSFKTLSNHEADQSLALLSLAQLWNHNSDVPNRGTQHSKCLHKIQEEKLRRQHCEQLIQQLQTRALELQERVAVAIEVDKAKDEAIVHIHKSWEETVTKMDALISEKITLQGETAKLKEKVQAELMDAMNKIRHYEAEASKALNLAHAAQEKLKTADKQIEQWQELENGLKTAQDCYKQEYEKNQQLSRTINQNETELTENKRTILEARKEIAQSKKAVEMCQNEVISTKNCQKQLEEQLGKEIVSKKLLEKQNTDLLLELQSLQKHNKSLQEDLEKQKQAVEQNKIELRSYYQEQVELLVREKLREFQTQLEKAEITLREEMKTRELKIAKAAAMHMQQISDKHALEVQLLEEKHAEEVKLFKLQLSQSQQQIDNMHHKIQQYQERQSNIAQQLHKVMEAQWMEALKIINNGKSPPENQDKSTNTIDQLNILKSRSYTNVEEILSKHEPQPDGKMKSKASFHQQIGTDDSYEKLCRSLNSSISDTPLTSRPQKNRQQVENELQKYIQMLLTKNNESNESNKHYEKHKKGTAAPENYNGNAANAVGYQEDKANSDSSRSCKNSSRDRSEKPPWK